MSSFYPPPPPTRRDLRGAGGLNAASRVGLPSWALSKLKLLVRLLSDKQPDTLHLTLGGLVMFVAGLVMLRIMSALPPQGKAFVVNIGAFAYPALTTTAELGSGYKDKLPAYSYYWVLFALSTTLDTILRPVTPFYYFVKACLLVWGASSARPYGGRPILTNAFETINNTQHPFPIERLASLEQAAVEQTSIPSRFFRFGLAAVAFAVATNALGICVWILVLVEGLFCALPGWVQGNVCVIAGAAWQLYATLVARAKAERVALDCAAAAAASTQKGGGGGGAHKNPPAVRQGPAAVQWLSYWPMYAFLRILDPLLGWAPHFYSVKLVVLALLALPQTRGAYLITSLLLPVGSKDVASISDKLSSTSSDSMEWVGVGSEQDASVIPSDD